MKSKYRLDYSSDIPDTPQNSKLISLNWRKSLTLLFFLRILYGNTFDF